VEEQANEKAEDLGKKSGEDKSGEDKSGEDKKDQPADKTVWADASPEPAKAVEPVVKAKSPRRLKSDLSLFDLAGSVLLLVILSFLVANCYVAYLGKTYNARVLQESIALAGKAANEGLDTPHVQLAAYGSWAHCAQSGFFIEHPEFVVFKDEIKPEEDMRIITISSSTRVRLPAPYLLLDKTVLDESDQPFSMLTFKDTYQYQLSHPKNVSGHMIKMPDGKVKRMPAKEGDPVAKPEAKPGAKPEAASPAADKNAKDAKSQADAKVKTEQKVKTDEKQKTDPKSK